MINLTGYYKQVWTTYLVDGLMKMELTKLNSGHPQLIKYTNTLSKLLTMKVIYQLDISIYYGKLLSIQL